jgi:hypothetical protein
MNNNNNKPQSKPKGRGKFHIGNNSNASGNNKRNKRLLNRISGSQEWVRKLKLQIAKMRKDDESDPDLPDDDNTDSEETEHHDVCPGSGMIRGYPTTGIARTHFAIFVNGDERPMTWPVNRIAFPSYHILNNNNRLSVVHQQDYRLQLQLRLEL